MRKSPYEGFTKDELILRDHLAIDRTRLANENTFLAYIRTALTMLLTGVSFIKFFDSVFVQDLGWIFIFVGVFVIIVGGVRYLSLRKDMHKIRRIPLKE